MSFFLNAFTSSATVESVDSLLLLLKQTFATARLLLFVQLTHVCCMYIAQSYLMKNDKIRSAAVRGGKLN